MITIQSAMLVALGFLAACLLALLVAPAFWSRAVRLTTKRIKETMPLSDIEIRADKDRIRAEYAIKVHKLESGIEQVRLAAARQQIEINRRDASINELERDLSRLKAVHEETLNARRVLEQTVSERLPRVEQRLNEAKRLLFTRERELADLTQTSERQVTALAEAQAINAQQTSKIERLTSSLTARSQRGETTGSDARFDGEVALRSEIEALRAKTREQAQLLARLQSMTGRAGVGPASSADRVVVPLPSAAMLSADQALAAREAASAGASQTGEAERQMRVLRSRNEDQASEIARLKAALDVYENRIDADGKASLRESRIGLKARMQALEAQSVQQTETIHKLRSELAAANERLARQASHFTNELRRLGGQTGPTTGQARRTAEASRLSLTERVAQARAPAVGGTAGGAVESNVAVLPRPANVNTNADASAAVDAAPAASAPAAVQDMAQPGAAARAMTSPAAGDMPVAAPVALDPAPAEPLATGAAAGSTADAAPASGKRDVTGRPRLLDRISALARTP